MVQSNTARFLTTYGMVLVLLLLVVLFSVLTVSEQHPAGDAAARALLDELPAAQPSGPVFVTGRTTAEDSAFVTATIAGLREHGWTEPQTVYGSPSEIRAVIDHSGGVETGTITVLTTQPMRATVRAIVNDLAPGSTVLVPPSRRYPTFLLADNLRNIANQISVIAIVAVGMTMVIITAGIDLSVGSLIALAAVIGAWLIGLMGGTDAGAGAMIVGSLGAIVLSGLVGAFSGAMITGFRIPPFIATLAMMQVASGLAYILSQGRPIYQLPESYVGLGRGAEPLLGIPWAVLLMLLLYVIAHFVMSRTVYGRAIYAVGGNEEAARLAGIRVKRVLLSVYVVSGALAGLGGIVMASQLKSGAPTYGLMYELYVIAAVVVGGTSLAGGEGRIFGTLIGAFIIAVIQNGMNLTNVESYTQKVVLGLVILAAVLLDRLKHQGWRLRKKG
ncbi:ABC transporter permease [bacterium]|nr:ABC transporter permease [bacterium]